MITRFQDIEPFTAFSGYSVTVPWTSLAQSYRTHVVEYGLDVNPDFQRAHVWTRAQQVAYVEFILRRGQTGRDLWCNCPGWQGMLELSDYVLVDGKQRLHAALGFLNDEFPVFGGAHYSDFTDRLRMTDAYFTWHVNTLPTRDDCLRWYLDLNRAGTPHTDEEIARVRGLLGQGGWTRPSDEERLRDAGMDRAILRRAAEEAAALDAERAANAAANAAKPKIPKRTHSRRS